MIEQALDGTADLSPTFLYGANTTETMHQPLGLTIEREYLYWTNTNQSAARHGAIHKAFTEPFVFRSPIMTYDVYHSTKAYSIASNDHFIFFTGQSFYSNFELEPAQLFVQRKQGALLVHQFSTDFVNNPKALLPYKDHSILVANTGFISQIDVNKYPPSNNTMHETIIEMNLDNQPTSYQESSSFGMVFISDCKDNVSVVHDGASSLIASAVTPIFAIIMMFLF